MNIREKLQNAFPGQIKEKERKFDLVDYYDLLIMEYGWIKPEEFLKIKIPLLLNMVKRISKRKKEEDKKYSHMRK